MNRNILILLLLAASIAVAFAGGPGIPIMPLDVTTGGTGAVTPEEAAVNLSVVTVASMTAHEVDTSTHGCSSVASATAVADHAVDTSTHGASALASETFVGTAVSDHNLLTGVHGSTSVASAAALSDHNLLMAAHGCTTIASVSACNASDAIRAAAIASAARTDAANTFSSLQKIQTASHSVRLAEVVLAQGVAAPLETIFPGIATQSGMLIITNFDFGHSAIYHLNAGTNASVEMSEDSTFFTPTASNATTINISPDGDTTFTIEYDGAFGSSENLIQWFGRK